MEQIENNVLHYEQEENVPSNILEEKNDSFNIELQENILLDLEHKNASLVNAVTNMKQGENILPELKEKESVLQGMEHEENVLNMIHAENVLEQKNVSSDEMQKHVSLNERPEQLDLPTMEQEDIIEQNLELKANTLSNMGQEKFLQNFKEKDNLIQKNVLLNISQKIHTSPDVKHKDNVSPNNTEEEEIVSSNNENGNVLLSAEQNKNGLPGLEQEMDILPNVSEAKNISSSMGEENILLNEQEENSRVEQETVLLNVDEQEDNVLHNVEQEMFLLNSEQQNNVSPEKNENYFLPSLEDEGEEYMGHFLSKVGLNEEGKCFLCKRYFEKREVVSVVGERGIAGITRACIMRNMKPYDICVGQLVHKVCRSRLLQINVQLGPPDFSKKRPRKSKMYGRTSTYKRRKPRVAAITTVTIKQEINTDTSDWNEYETVQPPVFVNVKQEPTDSYMYDNEPSENTKLPNMQIKQEPAYYNTSDKDWQEQPLPSQPSYSFEQPIKIENVHSYTSNETGNGLQNNGSCSFMYPRKNKIDIPRIPKKNSQEALFRLYSAHIPKPGGNTEGWTLLTDPNTMYKCLRCGFTRKCGDYIKGDRCFCGNKFKCMSCKCVLCELYFLNKYSLSKHMDSHSVQEKKLIYNGNEKFRCEVCESCFVTKREFTGHMEICRRNIKCELCDNTFNKRSDLISHWTVSHVDRQKKQCLFCGRYLKDGGEISRHILLHSYMEKKIYKCNTCGNCFGSSNALETHVCMI